MNDDERHDYNLRRAQNALHAHIGSCDTCRLRARKYGLDVMLCGRAEELRRVIELREQPDPETLTERAEEPSRVNRASEQPQ